MSKVFFNIPCIDSGIPDGQPIEEEFAPFEAPPTYVFNPQNLDLIHHNYPKNIVFDLEAAIGDVIAHSPPDSVIDFVELAEKACRIYDDFSQFYAITDEIFDGCDRDNFITALKVTGAFEGLPYVTNVNSVDVISAMYDMHVASLERFLDAVMRKLAAHKVPAFADIGCIYMPDAFICDTSQLVLKLKLDH